MENDGLSQRAFRAILILEQNVRVQYTISLSVTDLFVFVKLLFPEFVWRLA